MEFFEGEDPEEGEEQAEELDFTDTPFIHLDEDMTIPYLKQCAQCHRPGNNMCTSYKSVFYCSRECQTKHWIQSNHK